MALTHRQLEAFHVSMETGTVTGAAERLRISQPAVSKILAALEYDLKLKLFKRVRKRLVPTNEAHMLYVEVHRLMTSMGDIEEFARDLWTAWTFADLIPEELRTGIEVEPDVV